MSGQNEHALQKVLIVDDAAPIHSLIRARLAGEGLELHSAYDGETGLRLALEVQPDLILLDLEMPEPGGFEVCRRLKSDPRTMNALVLFLTGGAATEQKLRGLELGAVDYLAKPFDSAELRARVRSSLRIKALLDLLSRKAMVDGSTGLWNRAFLEARLGGELSLARRTGRPLGCILIGIDRLNAVRDGQGHRLADEIVRGLAAAFLAECRTEDLVCRYGAAEFLVLTPNVGAEGATRLAERLRARGAAMQFQHGGHQGASPADVRITCSVGVAEFAPKAAPMIARAEQALAKAAAGGNCVVRDVPPDAVTKDAA